MARLLTTTGGADEDAYQAGPELPLTVIEARVKGFQCKFAPTRIVLIKSTHMYRDWVVIEVTDDDPKSEKFPKSGFYLVLNLMRRDANSLFEPAPELG